MLCTTFILAVPAASAAVPTFPDNLVVFPDRDFVTIEGYQDRVGQTATIEVSRAGVGVIGSAQGVIAAGDVAFEVNHPGGVCWGAGTGLKVTPDIRPADTVSIKFGATAVGDTLVQDLFVTQAPVRTGSTVTVTGHIGTTVNRAQLEQRIVEPALDDTPVQRRDVRAAPGPLAPAPKGGYSSRLAFDVAGPNTFTATYIFDDAVTAQIAAEAGTGVRAMGWQAQDAADNRQGLTIAEFGEAGGPGMGGCPNGPSLSGPPGPTDVAATTSGTAIGLTWKPAVAIPGTPAITGYRVTAVGQTVTNNERNEIGRRIAGQGATGTTITGLAAGESYDVHVVALSSVGETFPAIHAVPVTDSTAPTVAATPAGGNFDGAQSVTLTASESGSSIYYTTDGSDVVQSGGVVSDVATRYTGPITVESSRTLRFVAFDPAGNVSQTGEAVFTIGAVTPVGVVAGAPAIGVATAGTASATVRWSAPASDGGSAITGYTVRAFSGTALMSTQPVSGNVGTVVFGGLTNGTAYQFDVAALNGVGLGPVSARSTAVTPQTGVVAPTVLSTTPASGARGVGLTTNPTAQFSGPVTGVSGETFVLRLGTASIISAVTYDAATRVATLDPNATLTADRTYQATLSGIRDVAGNLMTPVTWSFITGPAPVITTTTPGEGVTGVARNANVTATFSESITGTTAAAVQITQVSNGAVFAAARSFSAATRVLTINPTGSLLPNTQYRVTITGSDTGVRDLAGNPVATRTWVFTTGLGL